jgi:hypothetical protein
MNAHSKVLTFHLSTYFYHNFTIHFNVEATYFLLKHSSTFYVGFQLSVHCSLDCEYDWDVPALISLFHSLSSHVPISLSISVKHLQRPSVSFLKLHLLAKLSRCFVFQLLTCSFHIHLFVLATLIEYFLCLNFDF